MGDHEGTTLSWTRRKTLLRERINTDWISGDKDGWAGGWVDGWVGRWMAELMDRWTDGWIGGWMALCVAWINEY